MLEAMATKKTPLPEAALDYFRKQGAKGGKTRKKNMTKAKRSEQAKKAVTARWDKYREKRLRDESEGK